METDHITTHSRTLDEADVQPLCAECHKEKTNTEWCFDDGWRPFVSVLNPVTYAGYQLQPRERPFNWRRNANEQYGCKLLIDFRKHYRHALMDPGMEWGVNSPTDTWKPYDGGPICHLSWVDAGPVAHNENASFHL